MAQLSTTPVRFSVDASDEEILSAVRQWCDVMAAEDYDRALAMVEAPDWTAGLLREVVTAYEAPQTSEKTNKVTSLATARYRPGDEPVNNPWPRHIVDRSASLDGAEDISVWFDLPLDGYWSDLTATFDLKREGDALLLSLDDIHVM
ncbi:MAG: hypothetical protein QM636_13610 [Rhizobium sp.]